MICRTRNECTVMVLQWEVLKIVLEDAQDADRVAANFEALVKAKALKEHVRGRWRLVIRNVILKQRASNLFSNTRRTKRNTGIIDDSKRRSAANFALLHRINVLEDIRLSCLFLSFLPFLSTLLVI